VTALAEKCIRMQSSKRSLKIFRTKTRWIPRTCTVQKKSMVAAGGKAACSIFEGKGWEEKLWKVEALSHAGVGEKVWKPP